MAHSPQGRNRNLLPPHLQPGSQPRRASQQPREDQRARPPAPRHAAPDDRRCPLLSPLHPAPAQRDSELLPTRTRPLRRLTLCQTISAPRNNINTMLFVSPLRYTSRRKKGPMSVLIVDDDPTSLKLLHAQLESEGHAVFEAHDGVDALALLECQPVDAVISDILMPKMDGYRLCLEIRKHARLRDLPIVIYTSTYISPGDEKLALDMGADKYLKKPSSVETIVAALHEVIAQPHPAPQPKALQEFEVLKEYNERLVSKLKEKNTELMAAEVKFRALVEQSIVGIYIVQDDQFVYVNPGMAGILGRSVEEMTSRTLYDFLVPEDQALARENIRKLSLIHISEPTRLGMISYAVFCLK